MFKTFSAIALSLSAGAALAQSAAGSPPEAQAVDPNRVVCERYEETGSRLGAQRVCKTVRQWEEQRARERAAAEKRRGGSSKRAN